MIGCRLYQMSKQQSREIEKFRHGCAWVLSYRSVASQIIELWSGMLRCQDITLNSSLCTSNCFNTIRSLWHMGYYSVGKFHFQRQTLCKGAADPQLCFHSPELTWFVLGQLKAQEPSMKMLAQSTICFQ